MPKPLNIDATLIQHLGDLARITLPADRQAEARDKLQQLVDRFSALAEVAFSADHEGAGPRGSMDGAASTATHTMTPEQLRDDLPEAPPSTAEVLANAPQTAADCFVVARVVEP
jgi:Asp-tRNA(Asn)/Glu-tRNA(Gln) amidotransferase C subunit